MSRLRLRSGGGGGGGGGGGTPPPSSIYGPTGSGTLTQRNEAIRQGAGPLTVPNPGGGISFNSSASLQTAINNNPAGSTFVCSANAPIWNTSVNTGTKAPTIIFPGIPGQKVIDAGGANIPFLAGNNTTIRGGTWQNFGAADVAGNHCIISQDDFLIEDTIITGAGFKGIDIQGHRAVLRRLRLASNGVNGFGTGTTGLFQADNLTIENCDIYGNNTAQHNPGNTGGAFKVVFSWNGVCRNNWVHDNIGFGIWWDTKNYQWLIENNVCENNYFSGIFYEANYGSVIRNNYVYNNGKNVAIPSTQGNASIGNQANIRISDCPADTADPSGVITPVQVTRNVVDHETFGGNTGVLILLWDHTDTTARHVGNVDVFENQFWLRDTSGGRIRNTDQDAGAQEVPAQPVTTNFQLWDLNNRYRSNEYHVASTATSYWRWDTGTGVGVDTTYAQWQTFHPQDNIARIQI